MLEMPKNVPEAWKTQSPNYNPLFNKQKYDLNEFDKIVEGLGSSRTDPTRAISSSSC